MKKTIAYVKEPVYDFESAWTYMDEAEFKERFPKHYKNYKYHEFLLTEKSTQYPLTISAN